MSNSLWPHGLQHTRLPCPSQSSGVCSNSCPFSQWCCLIISSSVTPSHFAFNLSQHERLSEWVGPSHQVTNVLDLQLQHQSFQWIVRTDFLYDRLVGSPCSPRDSQESSPALQFKSFNSSVLSLLSYFNWRLITLQYCGFCHTFTWISHGCTCVPHPELPSHLHPHPIPQGHPSAHALSHALNLDWWSISHMIICMFQCYSLTSCHS